MPYLLAYLLATLGVRAFDQAAQAYSSANGSACSPVLLCFSTCKTPSLMAGFFNLGIQGTLETIFLETQHAISVR